MSFVILLLGMPGRAARPGQSASDNLAAALGPPRTPTKVIPPFLNLKPIITPRDLEALREKGLDSCTRRFTVGNFIIRLQTNFPDQVRLLENAFAFALRQVRKDREDLLRSAKANKLLLRKDKDYQLTKFPRLNDIDPDGWIQNCPLPVRLLLG